MRELYLVACGLLIGLSVRDWWDGQKDNIAWTAADRAEGNIRHRATMFRSEHIEPVEPTPATPEPA